MEPRRISEAVIRCLPRYYRHLTMLEEQGIERISSGALAEQMGLNASQIRQDFNCFGGFGQQGYGYHVKSLLGEITNILSLDQKHSVIIAGAGNIGRALANFDGFERVGFQVRALFDSSEVKIGAEFSGKPVFDITRMPAYIKENGITIGVIAARRSAAQHIADMMVGAGIRGIWNFAPVDVAAPVPVENVHLNDSIYVLSYRLGKFTAE